jgi:undecaprenyl-diphosphatase
MFLFGKKGTRYLAIELAILFILGVLAGEGLKYVTYRPRPFVAASGIVARLPDVTDSSFPSDHALIVSIAAFFALTKFKGTKGKLIAILLAIEAAIVSYSRIYLGLHYPLDVLGALFLGSSIIFVGLSVIERYFGKFLREKRLFVFRALRRPESDCSRLVRLFSLCLTSSHNADNAHPS